MARTCTRRSDQPISCGYPPRTSLSTRLPPFEHRVVVALPRRAAAPPPLVHATGFQRAFLHAYVAGGHVVASARALQLRHPFGGRRLATHGHLRCPRTPTSQAAAALLSMVQIATSVQGLRQAVEFFLAYFEYYRRNSTGYVYGHFWPSPFPPTPFVHYDFVANIIASSSTSLLRQPRTASSPLFTALRLTTVLEPPLLVSLTWSKVHTSPILHMLGASNTAVCLLPRCVPGLGNSGVAPRIWHFREERLRHRHLLRRLPRSSPRLHHARPCALTTLWRSPAPVASGAATSTPATPTTTSTTTFPRMATTTKVAAPTALGYLNIDTRAITLHEHSSASSTVQATAT
jgi:hypothetical protein